MSDQSMPAPAEAAKPWEPPTSDQEFEFTDAASVPGWIDKGFASYDRGPALALPAGDLYGTGPYHTITARVGDKVLFVAATPSKPGHFEVVAGEPTGENATKKPPQASAASLEDMLKTGVLSPDDLSEEAKAQVAGRSPGLAKMVSGEAEAPEAIPVTDLLKTT